MPVFISFRNPKEESARALALCNSSPRTRICQRQGTSLALSTRIIPNGGDRRLGPARRVKAGYTSLSQRSFLFPTKEGRDGWQRSGKLFHKSHQFVFIDLEAPASRPYSRVAFARSSFSPIFPPSNPTPSQPIDARLGASAVQRPLQEEGKKPLERSIPSRLVYSMFTTDNPRPE